MTGPRARLVDMTLSEATWAAEADALHRADCRECAARRAEGSGPCAWGRRLLGEVDRSAAALRGAVWMRLDRLIDEQLARPGS